MISKDEWTSTFAVTLKPSVIENALSGETTPLELNLEDQTALFASNQDSAPYQTTPEHCTCKGYVFNGGMCRHIARLAIELGWLDAGTPVSDIALAKQLQSKSDFFSSLNALPLGKAIDIVRFIDSAFSSSKKLKVSDDVFGLADSYFFSVENGKLIKNKSAKSDAKTLKNRLITRLGTTAYTLLSSHDAISDSERDHLLSLFESEPTKLTLDQFADFVVSKSSNTSKSI